MHVNFVLQISSYFADKLLRIVHDTILHMKGMSKSGANQHISDGIPIANNIPMGDPALEFIKHVCAVLALDQNVQHDILVSRVPTSLGSYELTKLMRHSCSYIHLMCLQH